jgi:O-succinylbenzoic acid--CoA ligase
MTETVSHIALMRLNGINASNKFQLLDGISADTDDRGCIKVKGDVTNNQWIQTNDIVSLQGTEFNWIGRADFVVNSGGIKLHLDQLHESISRLIQTEIVLLKTIDQALGETYVLVASQPINLSENEIALLLKTNLPKYHSPKNIIIQQELPKLESGKIDYQSIRKSLGL